MLPLLLVKFQALNGDGKCGRHSSVTEKKVYPSNQLCCFVCMEGEIGQLVAAGSRVLRVPCAYLA